MNYIPLFFTPHLDALYTLVGLKQNHYPKFQNNKENKKPWKSITKINSFPTPPTNLLQNLLLLHSKLQMTTRFMDLKN
ncbi:hypothetical protein CSW08_13575 [Confluentibacter flavum]|uniref:Uncharacterized protein n=1 Tax=Confluentibacter flavum TaxID=1909700 RepID=A0A2N3HHK4_9FLAO|nr:hypothetical protein CSW08_13575 [Confluentibacter flavum]